MNTSLRHTNWRDVPLNRDGADLVIVVGVVIFGAVIAGIVANRLLQPKIAAYNKDHGIGPVSGQIGISAIFGPVATLTVFVLGFALLTGSQSYSQAKMAIGTEAAVVDTIFETAAYLDEPFKRRLQRSAVCYSRAVAGPEWESMGTGSDGTRSARPWGARRGTRLRPARSPAAPAAAAPA